MKLYLTGEPCSQQRHCYYVQGKDTSFIMDCGYQRCYRGDELPHLTPEQIRSSRYLFRMKTSPVRFLTCFQTDLPDVSC